METVLRNTGKFLAILNAGVIIFSCFLQFSGVYNNCYCGSDKMGLGDRAYIVFLNSTEEANIAAVTWRTGFSMALLSAVGFIIYFEVSKRDIPPNRN